MREEMKANTTTLWLSRDRQYATQYALWKDDPIWYTRRMVWISPEDQDALDTYCAQKWDYIMGLLLPPNSKCKVRVTRCKTYTRWELVGKPILVKEKADA